MKFFLKFINLMVGAFPVIFTAEALQPFYHHTAVPSPVKNGNVTGFRQSCPETPQIMPRLLMGFWACNRVHFVSSGIQCAGDALDISALAGRIPALIGNNHRNLLTVQAVVQLTQALTQLL